MKALVWKNEEGLKLVERAEPQIINSSDIKIKIIYSGICGSDLQVLKKNQQIVTDIIIGHEAVGEIVEVGKEVTEYRVGEKVIIDPNQYCCDCYYCRKGLTNFCEAENGLQIAGINIDGTFAEYFVCNQRYIYKIPESMSLKEAVLIEPLACVINNIRAAKIKEDDNVLILGSGPMGALCQMVAKREARLVVATENSEYRRDVCAGFSDIILHSDELTMNKVNELTDNRKFDVIIDTVGNQMEYALTVAGKNARIVPMGMNRKYNFPLSPYVLIDKGIQLIGASEYNMLFIDTIAAARRYSELSKLITEEFSIDDYVPAFESILGSTLDLADKKDISNEKVVFSF